MPLFRVSGGSSPITKVRISGYVQDNYVSGATGVKHPFNQIVDIGVETTLLNNVTAESPTKILCVATVSLVDATMAIDAGEDTFEEAYAKALADAESHNS